MILVPKKIKSVSTDFPSIDCDGTGCHDLSFLNVVYCVTFTVMGCDLQVFSCSLVAGKGGTFLSCVGVYSDTKFCV